MTSESRRIAVLIDGDNFTTSRIERILAEATVHGTVTVRRIYANWSAPQFSKWRQDVLSHAIRPVHNFSVTTGKNATDIALVIDAMDLLHGGAVDGFCLVTSDSDFTNLALRIREQGLFVMGIGREQTPEALRNACNTFITLDDESSSSDNFTGGDVLEKIAMAVQDSARSDGWARLTTVGQTLKRMAADSDDDIKRFRPLGKLVREAPAKFEMRGQGTGSEVKIRS